MNIEASHVVLDACCIFNFCASGNLLGILRAISARVAVSQVVKDKELKRLPGVGDQENAGGEELEKAIAQGLLIVVDFESEAEQATYINYAAALGDDGESATGAIAFHRGWAIATDDKRARSFFAREVPELQVVSTLEVVKHWSQIAGLALPAVGDVLDVIRVKGRYMPPNNHPLRGWWETTIKQLPP